jgi:hypothetical protein
MNFKSFYSFVSVIMLLMLAACSDSENETKLVGLFASANLDLISIEFPVDKNDDIISINTFFDFTVEGLKSNGVDKENVNDVAVWSLSAGAISTIDQKGRLTTGGVAEQISVTAQVGHLVETLDIRVSAAKFDQVIQLNSTPVLINLCQAQIIKPVGKYINEDRTEEIRPVDNSVINTIEWIITKQEDGTPTQRAFIKTENNVVKLQALETGNVIINARAVSLDSGNLVTSADFTQALSHNLNSLKFCLKSETDLSTCTLGSTNLVLNNIVSIMAVGNYQASNGSNFNENISAYAKWGIDNTSNASIAFSTDRQQMNITGNLPNTSVNVSAACGNIEQTVQDNQIVNGVVLSVPVTCAVGNLNCLLTTANMTVIEETLTSLSVTANDTDLVDNQALVLTTKPLGITLLVTANFSNSSSRDITADALVTYSNLTATVIAEKTAAGDYTVLTSGDAEVQVSYKTETFTVKVTIPN